MKPKQIALLVIIIIFADCCKKDNSTIPEVETYSPKYIASYSATVGCRVISDGGSDILECGIYIGFEENPENTGNKFQMGSDTGLFLVRVVNLSPNTQYFIKAYSINSVGKSLGEPVSITTQETIIDYDNNVYGIVKIGDQYWMTSNLKTEHYQNGDLVGTTNPPTLDITAENSPKYQWSCDGDNQNTDIYGKLYTWYTITDNRNVCPDGWHVPTDSEWTTLETTLGGYSTAASKLKEAGNDHWLSPYNVDATNESCFSALPGGYRDWNGPFFLFQNEAYFWSSTESEYVRSWGRILNTGSPAVGRLGLIKGFGASVRCVRD